MTYIATSPDERAFLRGVAERQADFATVYFTECPTCGRTTWTKSEGELAAGAEPVFRVEPGDQWHSCPSCDHMRDNHFEVGLWAVRVAGHQRRLVERQIDELRAELAALKTRVGEINGRTIGLGVFGQLTDPDGGK